MPRAALPLVAILLLSPPARADDCDALASRVARDLGGSVRTRIGPAFKLTHPDAESWQVDCKDGRLTKAAGSWKGPGTSSRFAQLIARTTSAVFAVPEDAAASALLACVRNGARKAGTIAVASAAGLKVECYVNGEYIALDVVRR
ncbi:conserved hypothetical protein [Methylobacterium aquaticum]|uniref:Uncharacterized protein n=1 Tax=Methylobacterium aquaticum TaxID=270351 RepID=A0A0C6F7H1_9HYPH|nr:conserved hypothetical protein [Methylobacterium aquaticum]